MEPQELQPSTIELLEKPARTPCIYCHKNHLDYACDAQIAHLNLHLSTISITSTMKDIPNYPGKDLDDYQSIDRPQRFADSQILVSVEGTEPVTLPQLIAINSEANGGIPLEESDIEAIRNLAIGEHIHVGLSQVKRIS